MSASKIKGWPSWIAWQDFGEARYWKACLRFYLNQRKTLPSASHYAVKRARARVLRDDALSTAALVKGVVFV